MRELPDMLAGTHIQRACEQLAEAAKREPTFMVFNDVRVEAHGGESPGDLRAAWAAGMDKHQREHDERRRAFEQTPEGKAKLAADKRAADEEKRRHEEALRAIEASGVRTKYPWPGDNEVSGFGGGYEAACRDMIYAGLTWMDAHPDEFDANLIEKAIVTAAPGCTGAMFGAAMGACRYIHKNGWAAYAKAMTCRSED